MGEIAEMMLDGCLCAGCGEYLGHDNGFPEYCSSCQRDVDEGKKKRAAQAEAIAADAASRNIVAIEKAYGAMFDPAVGNHLRRQIQGMLRGLYVNHGGYITHDGIAATIDNNVKAQRKAEQRKAKKAQG